MKQTQIGLLDLQRRMGLDNYLPTAWSPWNTEEQRHWNLWFENYWSRDYRSFPGMPGCWLPREGDFPCSSAGNIICLQCRKPWLNSWVRKITWRRDRLPTPIFLGFPGGSDSKESSCNTGDLGSIPGFGRSPGGGNGNPLQYSCLENSVDRGALQAPVCGVANSQTQLSHTWP